MSRFLRFIPFLLSLSLCAAAPEFKPFDGPKPLAVMLVSDPWLMVMGSDTPNVVLYENGQLIQLKTQKGHRPIYFWKQLSQDELSQLISQIKACGPFPMKPLRIELTDATDQPETSLLVAMDGINYVCAIYGLGAQEGRYIHGASGKTKVPKEASKLYKLLANLNYQGTQEWKPKFIEAMIWPYEYAPEEPIHWPKDLPGLSSPFTIKRRDAYSIFLPGTELYRLTTLLHTRKERGAVEIEGKKWAVSVRLTFPSEPIWRAAFRNFE